MSERNVSQERRSFSHRTVFVGLGISLLLAAGVAVYIYVRYVRYERVAASHVPVGTVAALRIDLEKVVLYEPFRAHLLELVNDKPTNMPESRLERLRHYTGIELGVDTREVVLASGPGPGDFEIIVGGLFRSEMLLSGVERMMADEGRPLARSSDGALLIAPGGVALGQASDHVIVLGSSERATRAALVTSNAYQALALSPTGPGSFAVLGEALRAVAPPPARLLAPDLAVVDQVVRAHGDVELGTEVTLTTLVDLNQGAGPAAGASVQRLLGALQTVGRLPLVDKELSATAGVASRLHVVETGDSTVKVVGSWSKAEVDHAAAYLADLLRVAFGWR